MKNIDSQSFKVRLAAAYKHNLSLILGTIGCFLLLILALSPLFLPLHDMQKIQATLPLAAPSWQFLLGTDQLARDFLSRVLHGALNSLLIASLTVVFGLLGGMLIALIVVYAKKNIAALLNTLTDLMLAIPMLLLGLLFSALYGNGKTQMVAALALAFTPSFAKVCRSAILQYNERPFIIRMQLIGAGKFHIFFKQLLPLISEQLLTAVCIAFANAILTEATLNYLGLGFNLNEVSWGLLLKEAQGYLLTAPRLAIVPGFCITLSVFSFFNLGQGLQLLFSNTANRSQADWRLRSGQSRASLFQELRVKSQSFQAAELKTFSRNLSLQTQDPVRPKAFLEVRDLEVGFLPNCQPVLKKLNFSLEKERILGILGESGSGKTLTASTIAGLLSSSARHLGGSIYLDNELLPNQNDKEWQKIHGNLISYVLQDPNTAFNPNIKLGLQLEEARLIHDKHYPRAELKAEILQLFKRVGLKNVEAVYRAYPHELSGGMKQRALIALALLNKPKLLIADEATSALDARVRYQVLDLIRTINVSEKLTCIFISHDIRAVERICDEIIVMKDGEIVEQGKTAAVLESAQSPYTKSLLAASPTNLKNTAQNSKIFSKFKHFVAGMASTHLYEVRQAVAAAQTNKTTTVSKQTEMAIAPAVNPGNSQATSFANSEAANACSEGDKQQAATRLQTLAAQKTTDKRPFYHANQALLEEPEQKALISLENLYYAYHANISKLIAESQRRFHLPANFNSELKALQTRKLSESHPYYHLLEAGLVLENLSLKIYPGEILGLLGDSGSGKSTIARLLSGQNNVKSGKILYYPQNDMPPLEINNSLSTKQRKDMRFSMVFQNPYSSLHPLRPILQQVKDSLAVVESSLSDAELTARAAAALNDCEIGSDLFMRTPRDLSGGQRQRVAIACATVISPHFLIADEVVSALDLSVQAHILQLLLKLRKKLNYACIFISHDIDVLHFLCDRIAVLHHGRICELAPTQALFKEALHPYTREMLQTVQVRGKKL